MATIKHVFVNPIADEPGFTGTKPSDWNADHDITGLVAADVGGLGTLATQSGTFSGTSSGTNTGDQTTVSGNAGSATVLATSRNIGGIAFNGSADIEPGVSTVSVTTGRALALTDRNKEIVQTHASAQVLSIPAQSSVTWVEPTTILLLAHGAGVCTLDADTGVTLNGVSGGSVALNRYQAAVLRWISSDVWVISGTSAAVA